MMDYEQKEIDALREENEQMRRQLTAYKEYDALTGLFNKVAFYEKVEGLLVKNAETDYALICFDIERFKVINDLFGVAEGDRLLEYIGANLRREGEKRDGISSRITADIFAVLVPYSTFEPAKVEADLLLWLSQYPLKMTIVPAIGIYYIEDRDIPVNLMCDRALLAANSVKRNYMRHIAVYDSSLRNSLIKEQELSNDMESALTNKEFKIVLQPKCDMRTGKIIAAEALVRWQHPKKGLISPSDFIPVFEQNGFIRHLDVYVWEEVCILLREWLDKGNAPVPVSVNVSRRDLYTDNLHDILLGLLEKYRLDTSILHLEITESAYAEDTGQILNMVDKLRKCGFTIFMDDFGSGYSSLNMLKDINVDVLKIDLRFLNDFQQQSKKNKDILESVIRMGKWLQMGIVAEGVETREQVEFLLNVGCFYGQGYYYYRPMPPSEFEVLLCDSAKVSYKDMEEESDGLLQIKELFHEDFTSNMLLDNILGGVAIYEYSQGDLTVLRVNEGYSRITGYTPAGLTEKGKKVLSYVPFEDHAALLQTIHEAKNNPLSGSEVRIRRYHYSDEIIWVHIRIFFLAENGEKEIYYASLNDISQQQVNEERLRFSEQRFRLAMEATSNILFDYNLDKRVVEYSPHSVNAYNLEPIFHNAPYSLIENDMVFEEDKDAFLKMYTDIRFGKERASCEVRMRRAGGEFIWNRITLTTVGRQAGEDAVALGLIEDISKEKSMELQLKQNEKSLLHLKEENQETAFTLMGENALTGLIGGYCEENFPLYVINEEMLRMMDYDSYEDFRKGTDNLVINTIHPEDRESVLEVVGKDFIAGQEYSVKYRVVKKGGDYLWVIDHGRIVLSEDGRLAIISVCFDISEQVSLQNELEAAVKNTPGDIVLIRINSGILDVRHISYGMAKSLGYGVDEYREIIDQGRYEEVILAPEENDLSAKFIEIAKRDSVVNLAFKTIHKNGSLRWTNVHAEYVEAEKGSSVYHGILTDMTEQKEREEDLRISDTRFKIAMKRAKVNIWEYDFSAKTLSSYEQWSYRKQNVSVIQDVPESLIANKTIHPEDADAYRDMFKKAKQNKEEINCEVRIRGRLGTYKWYRLSYTLIFDNAHAPTKAIGVLENIDKQKRDEDVFLNVRSDFLTGLLSKGSFEENGRRRIEAEKGAMAFIIADVDSFASINERYGHAQGDVFLKEMSRVVTAPFGPQAVCGRIGEDEIAVLAPNMDEEEVLQKLSGILQDVNNILSKNGGRLDATISIGVAFGRRMDSYEDLLEGALKALLAAKNQGKNTYAVCQSEK